MTNRTEKVWDVDIGNHLPFVLIAGPCQAESAEHCCFIAEACRDLCVERGIGYIFKASYDKANRTSIDGKRGLGLEGGLDAIALAGAQLRIPTITDIHEIGHIEYADQAVDALQIPAFLCRQTDLLVAAGKTEKPIMVKKGQFLAPWDMANVADKIASTGNRQIMLCERGSCFGYNNLVNDFRGLPIMAQTGYPVIFDATHSVQQPGGLGKSSGGQREFVPYLARAAVAVGVAGVFMEVHEDPDNALSDGPNTVKLDDLPAILDSLVAIDRVVKRLPI